MGILFFASGLFSGPSYDKKGALRFFKDRVLRLLLPLAAYEFLLQPLAFQIALASKACGPELAAAGNGFRWYFSSYNRLGHGAGVSGAALMGLRMPTLLRVREGPLPPPQNRRSGAVVARLCCSWHARRCLYSTNTLLTSKPARGLHHTPSPNLPPQWFRVVLFIFDMLYILARASARLISACCAQWRVRCGAAAASCDTGSPDDGESSSCAGSRGPLEAELPVSALARDARSSGKTCGA